MKLGYMCGMANNGLCTIDQYVDEVKQAESLGFEQVWMGQVFSTDAISCRGIPEEVSRSIALAVEPGRCPSPASR